MLSTWCDWHPYARQFLLAASLLNMGEEEKAHDLFISAAGGVPKVFFFKLKPTHTQDRVGKTFSSFFVEFVFVIS